jgi:hypothetical protein
MPGRTALVILFLVNITTIGWLAFQAWSDATPTASQGSCLDFPDCAELSARADASLDEQLASRFAPIVYLPELDRPCVAGGAGFAPISVDAVLGNPEVRLRSRSDPGFSQSAPTSTTLYNSGADVYFDAYLDLPGNPAKPGCRYERDGLRFAAGQENVAYARIVRDDDVDGLVLQYWLFYYFNDWNNRHEGDWELIQLHFDASNAGEAMIEGPERISLSQHSSGEVATWQDKKVAREGDRPVVYVARGSHANYFSPGLYLGRGESGRGFGCDDAAASSRRLPLGVQLLPSQVDDPGDRFAWVEFKGYWGEVTDKGSEGSTGPMTKQNWQHPMTWQERLMPRSVSLPTRGLIGPDPARAFCGVVAFAADFVLPFYRDMPFVAVFAVGVLSVGVVGTLTTTRYMPIRVRPLRSRRRIGQVFTTALDIYRGRLPALLTIALTALPLSLLIGATWNRLGFDIGPLASLNPLGMTGAGRLTIGVVVSSLQLILSGAVVIAASTALMAHLAETSTTRHARWRELATVVLGRYATLLAVAALSVSLVGIPWAMRLLVRWAFIEQAMLIDGRPLRESFRVSSAASTGHSVWVAAALGLLAAATLLGPAVLGIVMIMSLKSVPPAYVHLLATTVQATILPYVAIALTLVYFDLQVRREDSLTRD